MTVGELMDILLQADPCSRVVFLGEHADCDDAAEISEVVIPAYAWTHEQGNYDGQQYDVRYPGPAAQRASSYSCVAYQSERVVVLSTGPTNLRFIAE